ncbi:MAG: peptidoglycan DD-metalloendopeptidase family protein, partial [Zoogloeaceae bacterium]|nr:peptidoglycan DD-metalloendopeptidase family protein [Zoogloeaceae bacterium]
MASTTISYSVGAGGRNLHTDVKKVQELLMKNGIPLEKGADSDCGPFTIQAIKVFQSKFMRKPDGLVEPGKNTWKRLTNSNLVTPDVGAPADAAVLTSVGAVNINPNAGEAPFFPFAVAPTASWHGIPRRFGGLRSLTRKGKSSLPNGSAHAGCDLYQVLGTQVYAVMEGKVLEITQFVGNFVSIAIDHGAFVARYTEVLSNSVEVRAGDNVRAAQKLAKIGLVLRSIKIFTYIWDNIPLLWEREEFVWQGGLNGRRWSLP